MVDERAQVTLPDGDQSSNNEPGFLASYIMN